MLRLDSGSHVYNLLELLSVCGEFPAKSLKILGDERYIKKMVHKFLNMKILDRESKHRVLLFKKIDAYATARL